MKTGFSENAGQGADKFQGGRSSRGNRRRTLIVRRATEIFDQKGYNQTTMDDIARAVGVKREAIYYYFADKVDILCEIIKPESEYLAEGLSRIVDLANVSPRDKLLMAIESHMSRFNPNYLEMAIALRELHGHDDDPRLAAVRRVWRHYQDLWVELIAAGKESGCFSSNLDTRLTAFAILGMCNSPSVWFRPSGNESIRALTETLVTLTLSGVEREKAT